MTTIRLTLLFSLFILVHARSYFGGILSSHNGETPRERGKDDQRKVCQTEECHKISEIIRCNMDTTVDPCVDFYKYACGNWLLRNPIPEGMKRWNALLALRKIIEEQVLELLEAGPKPNDILAVKLAKKWYISCMNEEKIEKEGIEPLVSAMTRAGGWPLSMEPDEWDEEVYRWQKVDDYYARLTGRNAFYHIDADSEGPENQSEPTGYINIGSAHMPPYSLSLLSDDEFETSTEEISLEDVSEQQDSREPGSEEEYSEEKEIDENNNEGSGDNDNDDNESNENGSGDKDNEEQGDDETSGSGGNEIDDLEFPIKKTVVKNKRRNMKSPKESRNTKETDKRNVDKTQRHGRIEEEEPTATERNSGEDKVKRLSPKEKYINYVTEVALAVAAARGTILDRASLATDVENLYNFQMILTKYATESSSEKSSKVTLRAFQDWYDRLEPHSPNAEINWLAKIKDIFQHASVELNDDVTVYAREKRYFQKLRKLLDKTPSRTIVNYIHWNFLTRVLKTSTKRMRYLSFNWIDDDRNEETKETRTSKCIEEVEMSDIIAYEFVQNYFPQQKAQTAIGMIEDVTKEVEYQIKNSEWLDEATKDIALGKLMDLRKFIGHPDWYKNTTIVKHYFRGFTAGLSYFENTLSYMRYYKWKSLRTFVQTPDPLERWLMDPITLNAFYMPYGNLITLTAADFQSPFFSLERPSVVNFGLIGVIMGHEVNHGYDVNGIMFDRHGNPMEAFDILADIYMQQVECFVDQYNGYMEKDSNYGARTVAENIADTMGLEAVFKAYRRRERVCQKPDDALPGLESFTNDQIFFLSFGNLLCSADIEEKANGRDPHSTDRLRVIGSVSNSVDFAEAFHCPLGSPMNPKKKCNIWKN